MSEYKNVEEVAKTLDIKPSTVKKYYLLFEQEHDYIFERNNKGQLMFSKYDLEMFQKLIRLKNEPGNTLSKAVKLLASELKEEKEVVSAIKEIENNMIKRFDHLDLKLNDMSALLDKMILSKGKSDL
ncbi:MerR family transcriptional regulator [Fictibacillus enclensis]|uniref:MerR family transcriptional regulator n=1 Tax=Fictibacillus enclensis TaxID=1017270 RepID=UPI0025A20942|nr:MerR family transcriptional regulator [Fictibacillus enclensis]MDM5197583.1 MerR family transcriptional regulator [Fictibacillus enclensis]